MPPTYEGTEQRCFSSMFVCLHDVSPATWQLHAYGQLLVRYYGGEDLVLSMPQVAPPGQPLDKLPPAVSVLRQLGVAAASRKATGGRKGASGGGQLQSQAEVAVRVVFQKRGGTERQLTNSAELLKACNRWRFTAPSGVRVRGLCWEVSRPAKLWESHGNCSCCMSSREAFSAQATQPGASACFSSRR
jgi:hypothetical protein